jgi:selenocysteine lyase/cysteine desulfurase
MQPTHAPLPTSASKGTKPEDIAGKLFTDYSIHAVAINWENIHGVRIAPHVYTSLSELDLLAEAIIKICA